MVPANKGRIYLDLSPPVPHLWVEEPDMPRIEYLLEPGRQELDEIPFPLSFEGREIVHNILREWTLCIKDTFIEIKESGRAG